MLEGIAQIMSEHETAHVSKVWRDGNYIFVLVESPIKRNDFIYPPMLYVYYPDLPEKQSVKINGLKQVFHYMPQ